MQRHGCQLPLKSIEEEINSVSETPRGVRSQKESKLDFKANICIQDV